MARLQFGATDQVVPSSHFINRHVITIRHYHKGLPSGVMHIDTLKNLAIDALEELKARDITQLDVAKLTEVTDLMLIASGTSTRHVAALAQNLVEKAKASGLHPRGVEGGDNADWVLVDLGDIVVHIMLPEARALYDLERLWADLPSDAGAVSESLKQFEERATMS
ncbi:hypothetical protein HaloA020_26560 [Halomonas sp. A020]|nr:hypothetical protein HaloA020_26560 [Halomonas sp. A020]